MVKAAALAAKLTFAYARIGILLDGSASMAGHTTQALRPMAAALATRDVLMAAAAHRGHAGDPDAELRELKLLFERETAAR